MINIQPSLEAVADIIAINHLAASYSEAMCRFGVEEAVQTYAQDGVLSTPTTADAIGRAAIFETISKTVSTLDFVFQTLHQGLVEVDGDRATTTFPLTEWARTSKDQRGILFLGVYRDDVVRTPEGWRFARRRLLPRLMGRPDFLTGTLHDISL
ncbi:nuclear transport factor 2 family protein [Mycolicibacterium fluoranthenivorans]|uniref:Nuclear transport factor 2 family protein n=1 Tax=Mycolicibacterium fluoranthenivorans TaxID=258505 RepID=A0A7G8PGA6_9MYCO|nr:nuclear transport factor 2 family protein [Mycolicibacterium fluoranthenivorans]QNJ93372.1 nuclear transport factor 2 family protein [Mycolicibacterium fluoranthenivorans]